MFDLHTDKLYFTFVFIIPYESNPTNQCNATHHFEQEQDHPHSTMTELHPQLMPKIVIGSDVLSLSLTFFSKPFKESILPERKSFNLFRTSCSLIPPTLPLPLHHPASSSQTHTIQQRRPDLHLHILQCCLRLQSHR